MKVADLQKKSVEELEKELISIREEQFKQNMQRGTGQLGQHHLLKETRRDVARIKTVLKQKSSSN